MIFQIKTLILRVNKNIQLYNRKATIKRATRFATLVQYAMEVKNAETLETNSVRQQLFDNLQPNLQHNLQLDTDVKVQDMEDRRKRLIVSIDFYVFSTNELLQHYISCNHLATISRQAFAKSILKPAIDDGYVQMLYPDKPNHRGQKYKLTEKGLIILRKLI